MAVKKRGRRRRSKAQAIREALETMGQDAAPKDVIAALAQKKIKVSAAQVSNVKAALRKGGAKGMRRGRRAGGNGEISIDSLLVAKQMVDRMGGVDSARRALDTLAKLS